MKWYRVHFDATRSDPNLYVCTVAIGCTVTAKSPVDAIGRAITKVFGRGCVQASVQDDASREWIPIEWEFEDYLLWVDERSATLAGMVSELSPAEELRMMGVPTLFDEVTP